jgi:alkanesulfonate monooxygenase SsuD/methylene tetrahydromethanopterin reductase-like flavin-dependent oxidoreductase (luciferase family)
VVVTSGGEWPGIFKEKSGQITRTKEALEIINASMGDKVVNYSGEVYNVQAFSTAWTTQPPPMIYAGAHRPKMMRMVTGLTDAIMLSDVQPAMFDWALAAHNEARATQEHKQGLSLGNFVAWHVKPDREASLWEARRELIIRGWLDRDWITPYLSPEDIDWVAANPWPFLKAFRERTGDIKDVPSHISDALVEGLTMSGDLSDIDRHIERLRTFEEAGFTEILLGIQDDPAEQIKLIGERVLPAIRS